MKPDKRELILRAAAKVFGEKGFHLATVEEIAHQAGVGKGTIYQYFDSKGEIFTQLHIWSMGRYLDALNQVLDNDSSFEVNFKHLLDSHAEHMQELAPMVTKLQQEVFTTGINKCEALNALRLVEERFGQMVQNAIDRGELRDIPPRLIVDYIEGVLLGMTQAAIRSGGNMSDLSENTMILVMHGISREKE